MSQALRPGAVTRLPGRRTTGRSAARARFALLAALLFLGACSLLPGKGGSKSPAEHAKYYSVTAAQTPFFRYGPQQGYGADSQLPQGTMMTLIRYSFGYSKVQLENGQQGYVGSEDLKPATPQAVAAAISASAAAAAPLSSRTPARGMFRVDPSDPRLDVPPEPLPEAKPEFRY